MSGSEFTEYVMRRRGRQTALVHRIGADNIASALFAREGCAPFLSSGRGAMGRFLWADGQFGLLRVYLRGGLLRWILKDAFVLCNRPLREFRVHLAALERGVAAPLLLGVCWRRKGLLYRGAIATELRSGMDLDAWLRATPLDSEAAAPLLRACGAVIRKMHDQGVFHADLQIKNILVADAGPLLLDFDRARIVRGDRPFLRACNLLRLRRSFERRGFPEGLHRDVWAGYGDWTPPCWLDALYRFKGRLSDSLRHGSIVKA